MLYFHYPNTFQLESGEILPNFTLAYHTYGKLNAQKNNVVWVVHALTANSKPDEWWEGLIGHDRLLNFEDYFIVCANNLGSCYGSTHALSENPYTKQPYFYDFPLITIRDIANSLELLRVHLELPQIYLGLGGSQGGQILMEWAIMQNHIFQNLFLIATNAKHSAWGIAFNESQRMAIQNDNTWGQKNEKAGLEGMKTARSIALLSYRNYQAYQITQTDEEEKLNNFKASSYQQYQGFKLQQRFNAFSYFTLSKAMDTHNVGRNRNGIKNALQQIKANTCIMAISSDILFPPQEQKTLAEFIPNAVYYEIDSDYGHDGFLLEFEKITQKLKPFLKK
jgi:homoserine O-acetyltransferase